MTERIGSAHRSVARTVCLPWAKRSAGEDVPHRLGIGQVRVEMKGGTRPDRRHFQTLDVKFQRQLALFQGIDDQLSVVAHESIHRDSYLSFGLHLLHLVEVFPRRQIQSQSLYVYCVDMHGSVEKSQDTHVKPELRNTDNRLNARLVIVGVGVAKDSEPLARNLEPLGQRDVKGI